MEKELESMQKFYNIIIEFFVNYSFQIIGAIIILFIGFMVAKKVANFIERFCLNKNMDETLTRFIALGVKITIISGVAIISLGKLGIAITPFVAAIGAMSLGAGLALQGLLSNFGAGISIIATRPFVVGNTITIQGHTGVVKIIKLAYTVLETEDKEEITIPNKHIVGETLINSFDYTVVEMNVGIEYTSDPKHAIEVISKVLEQFEEISKEAKAQVGIKEFADAAINIELRYWTLTQQYNEVQYKVNLAIYEALKENKINIPFPTVNIINHS
ncbi:MAG: mechanosensitive ion channel domain-containing protein [Arcobacteraceae bacterium]